MTDGIGPATLAEIARRGERMAEYGMCKQDVLNLAPTMFGERSAAIGIAYWHDELPLAVIAKTHGLTKPRVTQIAELFFRKCLHPARSRKFLSRQKPVDNPTINN